MPPPTRSGKDILILVGLACAVSMQLHVLYQATTDSTINTDHVEIGGMVEPTNNNNNNNADDEEEVMSSRSRRMDKNSMDEIATQRTTLLLPPPPQHERSFAVYEDWPQSRFETLRKDRSLRAVVPNSTGGMTQQQVECPQCLSILAGSVQGKRILLLNHELSFAGSEILLLHIAELLEQSGGSVRFLHLSETGPMLSLIEEKGMSYRFMSTAEPVKASEEDENPYYHDVPSIKRLKFDGFDAILANTAAVESWYSFFEYTAAYLPSEEMDRLMNKTIFWIHEYNVTEFSNPYTAVVLGKVHRVLFDSYESRTQWQKVFPVISKKSEVIHLSVKKDLSTKLQRHANDDDKRASRLELGIPARSESGDVVILQAASIQRRKGSLELVRGFSLLLDSISSDALQQRGWFLVFVGHLGDDLESQERFFKAVNNTNTELELKGWRSRIFIKDATADMVPFYSAADILVLNSPCEDFGLVLIEAMFSRIPTVSRACGGPLEIVVHNKTGLLLPVGVDNPTSLASALRRLTMGPNWRPELQKMGGYGLERARSMFSYVRMTRELGNVFSRLFVFSSNTSPFWSCTSSRRRASSNREEKIQYDRSHKSHPLLPPYPPLPSLESFYDLGCAAIGSQLYAFGGYRDLSFVSKKDAIL
mmetsp:Transcript_30506/g.74088  ORF Transcript_30506/g.74088 Transcript_30506/m.74088 type:complete len:648 (+) Transcript_30506:226-2169(+)